MFHVKLETAIRRSVVSDYEPIRQMPTTGHQINNLAALPFNHLSTLTCPLNKPLWAPWYASIIAVVNIRSAEGKLRRIGLTAGLMGEIAGCVRPSPGKFVFKVGR